jgi:hypothetical protein
VEVEQVSEAEESLLEESIDQTLDLNMLAAQQQQPPMDVVSSPQVQEPPQEAPRVHVSMAQPLQAVEEREETPERDAEPMSQDLKAADALSPPPSLSQIPDIVPATAAAHDSGSTTVVLETPQLPSEEFAAPQQQSQEASIDMIPETQRAPTAAAADDIDSQISRISESFVESQMPHRFPLLPDAKTGEKAVIIRPPGYRPASAPTSLKALKQKGKARGAISPVAEEREAAPAQARRTASLSVSPSRQSPTQQVVANEVSLETSDKSADISRISASSPDTSAANASAVSNEVAVKSKPLKKRKSIIEVVIPYRHDISREGSTYSGETSRKSRKSKAAEAGSSSKILEQMPSSSYPARKISPLKKTASESLTYTRKPAVSLKASSSLPIADQEEEAEDDFLLTSSSSPIRDADITDSFSVNRRRHGDNNDTVSSSPVCQAEKRKRERSNSNSQGSSASSHRLLTQSPPASIADDLEILVDTITGLDEAGLRRLLNRLPSSRLELLRGTSEKTLKERASKKPRRA